MLKHLNKFLALLLVCFSTCYGQIFEIKHIYEIYPHITKATLVVFDIDNTLMETTQALGSDQWFYHQLQSYMAQNLSMQEALNRCLNEYHALQFLTKVQLPEATTSAIVGNLQDQGYMAMGLTTRGFDLAHCTENQLHSIGIDLTKTAPTTKNVFFNNPHKGVLFHGGILFTQATHKGHAFFKFLDTISLTPSHVVFVNDKATHIKEIETMCHERGVPFVGLRYGFLDEKVQGYDPAIGDVQFKFFGKFITDQEAEELLNVILD